jgi:hypothetical protein
MRGSQIARLLLGGDSDDALAAELPVRGELSYDEACKVATAAMDGHPAPVIPATARRE